MNRRRALHVAQFHIERIFLSVRPEGLRVHPVRPGREERNRAHLRILLGDVELLLLAEMDLPHTRSAIPPRVRNAVARVSRLHTIRSRVVRTKKFHLAKITAIAIVTPHCAGEPLCYSPPMAFNSFRDFVAQLEAAGELRRVSEPLATELEITELADREMKKPDGGKALLLEKPIVNGQLAPFP